MAKKAPISFITSFCPSVRQSACISTVPTGRISPKFDTANFGENVSRHPELG